MPIENRSTPSKMQSAYIFPFRFFFQYCDIMELKSFWANTNKYVTGGRGRQQSAEMVSDVLPRKWRNLGPRTYRRRNGDLYYSNAQSNGLQFAWYYDTVEIVRQKYFSFLQWYQIEKYQGRNNEAIRKTPLGLVNYFKIFGRQVSLFWINIPLLCDCA